MVGRLAGCLAGCLADTFSDRENVANKGKADNHRKKQRKRVGAGVVVELEPPSNWYFSPVRVDVGPGGDREHRPRRDGERRPSGVNATNHFNVRNLRIVVIS
jgi:hypothetical protein